MPLKLGKLGLLTDLWEIMVVAATAGGGAQLWRLPKAELLGGSW
jgi:hypothetical protein